jgi:hypothetical protein
LGTPPHPPPGAKNAPIPSATSHLPSADIRSVAVLASIPKSSGLGGCWASKSQDSLEGPQSR